MPLEAAQSLDSRSLKLVVGTSVRAQQVQSSEYARKSTGSNSLPRVPGPGLGIGDWYHALKKEFVLHFIPALLLLLVNGHLGQPGELAGFLPAQRMIVALSQPKDSLTLRRKATSMAIRVLAWVGRWKSPTPSETLTLGGDPTSVIDNPMLSIPEANERSDRSRDGPA